MLNEDNYNREIMKKENPKFMKRKDFFSGSVDYSEGKSICGFRNIGDSDYFGAAVQVLFATYPLTRYFLTDAYKEHLNEVISRYKGYFVLAYVKLLILHKNTHSVLAPYDLY